MMEYCPPPQTLLSLLPDNYHGEFTTPLLVTDIQINSRNVAPGALFIALSGTRDDGEKYISAAIANGAVAILIDESSRIDLAAAEAPIIRIRDLRRVLPHIVKRFFASASAATTVFGVTGTNGKSTITSMLAQLATLMGEKGAVIGTLGYGDISGALIDTGLTTPDIVTCHRLLAALRQNHVNSIAMEVSSHGIDQGRVAGIAFDAAIISNVTRDHLDYHGTLQNYVQVKQSFLMSSECQIAVVNLDDDICKKMLAPIREQGRSVLTYGIDDRAADVCAEITAFTNAGMSVSIRSPWGHGSVDVPYVGAFNLHNLLAAITAHCATGKKFSTVIDQVSKLRPVAGRLQKVTIGADISRQLPDVFVDYAHTPDALEQVLTALRQHVRGNLWVVFGCGGDRDKGKRPLMAEVASRLSDRCIVTSDNPRTEDAQSIVQDVAAGLKPPAIAEIVIERQQAIAAAINNADAQDTILLAGKGHEDYQIIGDKKIPFSDYLVAKDALTRRLGLLEAAR